MCRWQCPLHSPQIIVERILLGMCRFKFNRSRRKALMPGRKTVLSSVFWQRVIVFDELRGERFRAFFSNHVHGADNKRMSWHVHHL